MQLQPYGDHERRTFADESVAGEVLGDVRLDECRLDRVTFRRCSLDAVTAREARLQQVRLEDCVVRSLDLARATVTDLDLSGARLERVDPDTPPLTGWHHDVPGTAQGGPATVLP